MIAAAALIAVVLTNSSAEREALTARWTQASRQTVPADRRLRVGAAPSKTTLAPLRDMARRELSVPGRYTLTVEARQPPAPTWWDRFVGWARDRWNAVWRALFGRLRISANAVTVAGDVVIAVLVFIVAAAAVRLIALFGRRRSVVDVHPLVPKADAAQLYAAAAQRADRGEYAIAARLLFRATLALLDVRGTVRDDASATVGDIRRRLPEREIVPAFDAVAAAFVAGTYAERPLDAAQWQRARDAYLSLEREPAT
jgi:hypothetical protein